MNKTTTVSSVALAIFLFSLCLLIAGCKGARKPNAPETPTPALDTLLACEDGERIVLGDYVLNNNVWNKGDVTDYTQCVFAQSDTMPTTIGWRWQWPGSDREIKTYPEVMIGDSPWDGEPPTGPLPLPVDAGDILVTYDAALQASGHWNVALEMWLTRAPTPTPENITDEVMVWVAERDLVPGPPTYAIVTLDDVKYSVHVAAGHGDESGGSAATWSYVAFYARQPVLSGTLNMKRFLDYLLEEDLIAKDRYIASIEMGTEVASGEGEFILSNYEITFP